MRYTTARLLSEAAIMLPTAAVVRWMYLPGAWERDIARVRRLRIDARMTVVRVIAWVHRLTARLWGWTREPERRWAMMRASVQAGGYADDTDGSGPKPESGHSPDDAPVPGESAHSTASGTPEPISDVGAADAVPSDTATDRGDTPSGDAA